MKKSLPAILLLALSIAGCKVVVIAPPHVAIVSEDMSFACMPGETCEIEVSDHHFDMALYAVPKPGYSFLYWRIGPDHLCPGFFSNKCHISTRDVDPNNEAFTELLHSDHKFYLEPVYRRDESAPELQWEGIEDG